jgi:hypothetical protein
MPDADADTDTDTDAADQPERSGPAAGDSPGDAVGPDTGAKLDEPVDPHHVPENGDSAEIDIEERWSAIVAELSDLGAGPAARGDRGGDEGTDAGGRAARIARMFDIGPVGLADGTGQPPRPRGPRDWPITPEVEALEEAETHFIPPDPPRVLGQDPLLTMAWSLVVGTPVVMLVLMMFWHPFPTAIGGVAAVGFLAGLTVLFWRMPHKRDDDNDPGAVV